MPDLPTTMQRARACSGSTQPQHANVACCSTRRSISWTSARALGRLAGKRYDRRDGVMPDAAEVAATYFEAWKARDFGRLRSVLADDVDFAGPLARVRGGDDCLRGLQGMAQIMTGLDVRRVFHD